MDEEYKNCPLVLCSICGRNFAETALERHQKICANLKSKPRKVFDSSMKRAEGTELASFKKPTGYQKKEIPQLKKKSNWKEKHLEFITAIRYARGVQHAEKYGTTPPPVPPPMKNPDYIRCEYCERNFNEGAAERHINFCRSQHEKLSKGRGSQMAAKKITKPQTLKPGQSVSRFNHDVEEELNSRATKFQGRSEVVNHRNPLPSVSSKTLPRNGLGSNSTVTRTPKGTTYPSVNERSIKPQDRVPSGPALRTGRTAQTYNDAKQLSAKQRANNSSASRKYPSSDNLNPSSRYPSHTLPSSQSQQWMGNNSSIGDHKVVGMGRASAGRGSSLYGASRNTGPQNNHLPRTGGASMTKNISSGAGKFCYECGAKFPTLTSKFCCECGAKKCT